jgi:hypothetical protein
MANFMFNSRNQRFAWLHATVGCCEGRTPSVVLPSPAQTDEHCDETWVSLSSVSSSLLGWFLFTPYITSEKDFFKAYRKFFSVDRFPARNQLTLDLFPRQVLDQRLGLPAMMALVLTRTNAVIIMASTSPTLGTDQTNFFVRVASRGSHLRLHISATS